MSMTLGACGQSLFRPVDLCLGCSCVQVATKLFDPRLARWHKADISQPRRHQMLAKHCVSPLAGACFTFWNQNTWISLLLFDINYQYISKDYSIMHVSKRNLMLNFCTIPISTCKAYSPVDKMLRAKQGALYMSMGQSMTSYFVRAF